MAADQRMTTTFVVCDAHHLCFKDRSFDAVLSSRVLMHLVEWQAAVREMCRVASQRAVVDFPSRFSFALFERAFRFILQHFKADVQNYRLFTPKSVHSEFNKNHFRVSSEQRLFFLPVAFYRKMNSPKFAAALEAFFRGCGLTRLWGSPVLIKGDKNRTV